MFGKLAQGTAEYLVMLGIVFLVAVIALALLGFYPAVGAEARKTQADIAWRSANPIGLVEYSKEGQVMMLALFNNDAQGAITVTSITVNNIGIGLQSPTKIAAGTAAKVYIVLPDSENCTESGSSYAYKIRFAYVSDDGIARTQEGPAALVGTCFSEIAASCEYCSSGELCCPQAFCSPADGSCTLCGNEIADFGENCENCPADVQCQEGQICLGGECVPCIETDQPGCSEQTPCCDVGATCSEGTCAECRDGECWPPPVCGDGICEGNETYESCPADCYYCGDWECNGNETCETCPEDCGECPTCGNFACEEGETCENCYIDCSCCGNGICEPEKGETVSCVDCHCGNGLCEPDKEETVDNCPEDCPAGSCIMEDAYCEPQTCCPDLYCKQPGQQGGHLCDTCKAPREACDVHDSAYDDPCCSTIFTCYDSQYGGARCCIKLYGECSGWVDECCDRVGCAYGRYCCLGTGESPPEEQAYLCCSQQIDDNGLCRLLVGGEECWFNEQCESGQCNLPPGPETGTCEPLVPA